MANKLFPWLTGAMAFGVFFLALALGGIAFQTSNNVANPISNNPNLISTVSTLNSTLLSTSANVSSGYSTFGGNSTVTTGGVIPYISVVGGIWKLLTAGLFSISNVILGWALPTLFGTQIQGLITIVLGAIFAVATIVMVIYLVTR